MKKILIAVVAVLLCAGQSFAEWTWPEDFVKDFDKLGLDRAVENSLDNDITPHEILTFIISNNEKFNIRISLKALYCAGVDRETVREAANKLGITIEELSKALEESIAECGSKLALNDRDILEPHDSGPHTKEEQKALLRTLLEKPHSRPKHYASPSTPSQFE